jgi:hypothetical protein
MSASSFDVEVDTTSLSKTARDQIAGVVYVQIDGTAFPEARWSDSVIVVLSSWLEVLQSLRPGSRQVLTLRFFDGPFRLEVRDVGEQVLVRAIDSRGSDAVVDEAQVDLVKIRRSVTTAALQVLRECSKRCWWSPDIDHLVRLTSQ